MTFRAPSTVNPELKSAELEKIRRTTAPIVYEQEYEARFVEMAGALLKRDQIRYGPAPERDSLVSVGFGIDLALATHDRSDYSALVVTGIDAEKNLLVLFARRWRKPWPETVVLLAEYNRIWRPQIAICEQVAFQELAVRDLEKAGLPLVPLKVSKGHEERFLPVLTKFALGLIWFADTN